MEIRIGIQNVAREVVIESDATHEDVARLVSDALSDGGTLRLKDSKGRLALIPAPIIGYVEIGSETPRKVGFVPTPGA